MKARHKPNFEFLDPEEREIAHLDINSALPDEEREKAIKAFRTASEAGKKSVTMRLSDSVISGLKARAEADGIPYQTLASIVLQKYVRGALLDKDAVREVVEALKA